MHWPQDQIDFGTLYYLEMIQTAAIHMYERHKNLMDFSTSLVWPAVQSSRFKLGLTNCEVLTCCLKVSKEHSGMNPILRKKFCSISKVTEFEIRIKTIYLSYIFNLICASLLGMSLLIIKRKPPKPSKSTTEIKLLQWHTLTLKIEIIKMIDIVKWKHGILLNWWKLQNDPLHGFKRWPERVQSQIKQTYCNSTTHSTPPIKPLTRHTLTHTIEIVN